jgi:cephalosporin hydroxylase
MTIDADQIKPAMTEERFVEIVARESEIIDAFHRVYYDGRYGTVRTHNRVTWMGHQCIKNPLDLMVYQEILFETRPNLIVETGTYAGGSALFFAHMLDIIGNGQVVSIDVNADQGGWPQHPRIRYVRGSSADPGLVAEVFRGRQSKEHRLVVLDSDHTADHVLKEMELFAPYVPENCYMIVEDGNINGHPVAEWFGPGPTEALEAFLPNHPEFWVDRSREKFLMTSNPGGYLKRVRAS